MASTLRMRLRHVSRKFPSPAAMQCRTATNALILPGFVPAGRMADAERTIVTDPRCDPRMAAIYKREGLAANVPHTGLTWESPDYQSKHAMVARVAAEWEERLEARPYPEIEGLVTEDTTITGIDGNPISLSIIRPEDQSGPLPCAIRVHGGSFCMFDKSNRLYKYWARKMAESGMVVVSMSYRKASGEMGNHPYPAALNDIISVVDWAHSMRSALKSHSVFLAGDQAGSGLSCGAAIELLRKGKMDHLNGVFAQFPVLYGNYDALPAFLPSVVQNDGYLVGANQLSVMASLYDLGGEQFANENPTCWPLFAKPVDLKGLCPHVITVNELDLNKDDGVNYAQMLKRAGVQTNVRCIMGASNNCEQLGIIARDGSTAAPEMHEFSIRTMKGFADSLAR